jgi:thiamine kinase
MSSEALMPAERDHLETLLDDWRQWDLPLSARPALLAAVPGGRTNRNFRLSAPGMDTDLLFRLNHPDPARLGIDRRLEHDILALAASADISRPCCHWDARARYALFPYLEARNWTAADFADPEQRQRLWPMVQRLGQITLDRPRRRYGPYIRHYWDQLTRAGLTDHDLEARWRAFEPALVAFDQADWSARLVHHDLIPANVLETADRLYLIDWEYAAMGHPDIDIWSVDPGAVKEPFIAEMMGWVIDLWERLMQAEKS